MQRVICRHVANCVAYVYLGYDARQTLNSLPFPLTPPLPRPLTPTTLFSLLQLEAGVRETGDGEDGDPETLRDGEIARDARPFFTITTQQRLKL